MRKFKLIKTYPGYKTLGVTAHQCTNDIKYEIKDSTGKTLSFEYTGFIENNSEFWQEFVEKDYEILSFICNPHALVSIVNSKINGKAKD